MMFFLELSKGILVAGGVVEEEWKKLKKRVAN